MCIFYLVQMQSQHSALINKLSVYLIIEFVFQNEIK